MNCTGKLQDFCFAADENYSMPLTVCIGSLIWSVRRNPRPIQIHVLDLGIDDKTWCVMTTKWEQLVAKVGLVGKVAYLRHRIDKSMFEGMMPWHGSVATYARLLIPQLLPDVQWCLYSDGDVLFVESPFELDLYCSDSHVSVLGHKNPPGADEIDGKWFRDNHLSFNEKMHLCAGFLLMNLDLFRRQGLSVKALDFLRTYKTTASADQCAINYICADSLKLLPRRWGVFCGEITHDDCDERGGAIHYADGAPWKPPVNCTMLLGLNPAVAEIWRKFAVEITGFCPHEVRPSFAQMMNVRTRSFIIWCLLHLTGLFGIEIRRYKDWPGKFIEKATVKKYRELLFQ